VCSLVKRHRRNLELCLDSCFFWGKKKEKRKKDKETKIFISKFGLKDEVFCQRKVMLRLN